MPVLTSSECLETHNRARVRFVELRTVAATASSPALRYSPVSHASTRSLSNWPYDRMANKRPRTCDAHSAIGHQAMSPPCLSRAQSPSAKLACESAPASSRRGNVSVGTPNDEMKLTKPRIARVAVALQLNSSVIRTMRGAAVERERIG